MSVQSDHLQAARRDLAPFVNNSSQKTSDFRGHYR